MWMSPMDIKDVRTKISRDLLKVVMFERSSLLLVACAYHLV